MRAPHAIKGAATTLIDYRQRLPDDRIEGFLHSIDAQTDRLNGLLDDLVLLAKIQAGVLRLQPEPIVLRTVIGQTINQLPPDQRDDFSIEGSDPQIMADTPYLRHALVLLLQHLYERATAQTIIRCSPKRGNQRQTVALSTLSRRPVARIDEPSAK